LISLRMDSIDLAGEGTLASALSSAHQASASDTTRGGAPIISLAILREEKCLRIGDLMERGCVFHAREELARTFREKTAAGVRGQGTSLLLEFIRDPLRKRLGRLSRSPCWPRRRSRTRLQIRCRRTKHNPFLIGEPGWARRYRRRPRASHADGDVSPVPPPIAPVPRLSLIVAAPNRCQFPKALQTS